MPSAPARPWLPPLLWLLVLLPASARLFGHQLEQPVDAANTALKAPGTADEANRRALAAAVESEQVILLAFSVPGELPVLPVDEASIARGLEQLRTLPGVIDCRTVPAPDEDLRLATVALDEHDLGETGRRVVDAARGFCPPAMRFSATGLPLVEARLAELVSTERRTIVPMLGACLLAFAWLIYRRVSLALAALLPALLAIVWTSGLIAALGHHLDPVASLLDPVLLTIGVATSVHFVECWCRCVATGLDSRAASRKALAAMQPPTLLATATTMVGLLSLAGNAVPAVADFGIRAAFGVSLLHAFVFLLLPTWLAWFGRASPAAPRRHAFGAAWFVALQRHRFGIGAAAIAVTALAAAQLSALRSDNDPLTLLPTSEPCRVAYDQLAARLGGVETFHLLAHRDTSSTDLSRLLPFVASLQTLPHVAGMGGPLLRSDDGDLAAALLLEPGGSRDRSALFDEIERGAKVLGLDGLVPAGAAVQIARDSERLVGSLLQSTLWTIALLGLGMCVGLRSWRLGLLGLVPTVTPCIWVYGALAYSQRPVSVATGMIACTMLGLLVDNTVHFLHQFQEARRHHPIRAAIAISLGHVGRPMLLSSALLAAGFGVAATSQLSTTVEFSVLACTTIAAALFATSALLPLLLLTAKRRRLHHHAL